VIRAQTVVLVSFAAVAGGEATAKAMLAIGAVGFVGAHLSSRRVVIDVVQELSLVAMAVATTMLRWGPAGWIWGALAAGTLMHGLRFTVAPKGPGQLADRLGRSIGIGLPMLPVVAALLEGVSRTSGSLDGGLRALVVLALLLGLAGHSREPSAIGRDRSATQGWRAAGALALAGAGGLWALLLALPRPPASEQTWWPPSWGGLAVVAAGVAGIWLVRPLAPGRAPPRGGRWITFDLPVARLDRMASPRVLAGAVAALGTAAVMLWLVGLARGFL
jgi:hypothetical protein